MIEELFIESTNLCNGRCVFCWYDHMNYPKGFAKPELTEKLMNELDPKTVWLHLAGEPTLAPDLPEHVKLCEGKAGIVTNARRLTKELAEELLENEIKWIINSVVSSTPENYSKINGLDMERVQRNIIDLHELKQENGFHTRITNRIILCEENQHELTQMKKIWKPFCDDLHVVKEFTVPEKDRGVVNAPRLNCLLQRKLYRTGVVKWDGNVVPCCTDMDGRNIFGNVYHNTFKSIYYGERFEKYRDKVASDNMPEICGYCSIAPSMGFRRFWRKIYG